MTTYYLGVDPGKSGAISILDEAGGLEKVLPIPVVRGAGKGGNRSEYDLVEIRGVLEEWRRVALLFVTVEKSRPLPMTFNRKRKGPIEPGEEMPDDEGPPPMSIGGSIVNFHRGVARGWEWMLVGMGIPHQLVEPMSWQAVMLAGTSGTDTKQKSVLAAHRLFPNVSLRRTAKSKVLDHNLSDAILIGEFGRRMRVGALEVPGRKAPPPPPPLFR